MVSGSIGVLADKLPFPPEVSDFYLPGWQYPWVTKFTVLVWIGVALLILYFLTAYRNPKLVPTRSQWMADLLTPPRSV